MQIYCFAYGIPNGRSIFSICHQTVIGTAIHHSSRESSPKKIRQRIKHIVIVFLNQRKFGICLTWLTATCSHYYVIVYLFFTRSVSVVSNSWTSVYSAMLRLYAQWLTTLFCTGRTIHPLAITCYSVWVGIYNCNAPDILYVVIAVCCNWCSNL